VIDSVVLGPGRARRISDAPQGPDIKGGLRESGKVKAGHALLVLETEFGPVGISVCLDLGFPRSRRS